ncbi:MAG TPA: hypothetical protein VG737_11055 [Cyclobacteriaceae bacterium]|nr:hypothetical protein [Cyclobacteriaceae bacterium]
MKPIFSRGESIDKMAFMNWRMHGESTGSYFMNLAEGYLSSAIILAKQCLINNRDKKADILIFPILANANHGIELYLKAIIWMLSSPSKLPRKIERTHDIERLFQAVRSTIKSLGGPDELKAFEEGMVELASYIEELMPKINATATHNKMDFARYPISLNNENHFYVDILENVEVDLENFVKRFEIINDKLRSVGDHVYERSGDQD